jgi:GNAT superfamily N-acetyltransferase
MTPNDPVPVVDAYWADLLGIRVSVLNAPAPSVYIDEGGIAPCIGVFRAGAWKLRLASHLAASAGSLIAQLDACSAAYQADDAAATATAHSAVQHTIARQIEAAVYGPSELVYCARGAKRPTPPVAHRPITPADGEAVRRFRDGMGGWLAWAGDAWPDDAAHEPGWARMIGHWEGDRLVATAAAYVWHERIAELYVDTLPDWRGRGLATGLGGHITEWVHTHTPYVMQSGGEVTNIPSMRMSQRIGFSFYGMLVMTDLSRT